MRGLTAERYERRVTDYTLAIRYPGCGHKGTFEAVGINDLSISSGFIVGLRRCPNAFCRTIVYYIRQNSQLLLTFPFDRIEFGRTDIPGPILSAFEEAISCHANQCFVASAMMIRKTLDLLCIDKGAKGGDLKDRIASLKLKVLISQELFEGMDGLRLLGNDAAHVESRTFDDVGKEEIEVAIEFVKELVKAVYQYSGLVARLESLKKKASAAVSPA